MQIASRWLLLLLLLLPTTAQGRDGAEPSKNPRLSAPPGKTIATKAAPVSKANFETKSPSDSAESPPLKLSPPPANLKEKATGSALGKGNKSLSVSDLSGAAVTMLSALGIVLGLFITLLWILKRRGKGAVLRWLPKEAFEVLGRAHLTGRQTAHLVRCGNKIVVLAISPTGIDTITEITDPLEVDRLAGICYQGQSGSASANFSQLLSGLGRQGSLEPARAGGASRTMLGDYDV